MKTSPSQSNSASQAQEQEVHITLAASESPKDVGGGRSKQARRPDISHFDSLPSAALIAINEMAAVMGKGVSSAWRDIKSDPDFPQPIRLSAGCTRFNVGDIRGYLTKKVSMSAKPMRAQQLKKQVAA